MPALPPRSSLYCAAFLIFALSGVGLLWRGPANRVGTAAYVVAEYRKEAATLQLPPGSRWPAKLPFTGIGPDGVKESYGKGMGTNYADDYWFCSWAKRALDRRLPAAARHEALAQLPSFRNTYEWKHVMPPDTRASENAMIEKALRGNTAELRANCSWFGGKQ
jgi:hypothetical protein